MSDDCGWPGAERRRPSLGSSLYVVRSPLARWLEEEARVLGEGLGELRVLDVGCGAKPYYPFFRPYAGEYVGVDVVPSPSADLQGSAEALPVGDARFDVVLCNQVLEHCEDPARAVAELARVTAPGGRVLASTHGVQTYHPSPADYWRWTHTGLERLFSENADWARVSVTPGAGTAACLGMLLGFYVEAVFRRARLPGGARPLVAALNGGAAALDRRAPWLREPRPGRLFANFHVRAERPVPRRPADTVRPR